MRLTVTDRQRGGHETHFEVDTEELWGELIERYGRWWYRLADGRCVRARRIEPRE